MPVARADIDYIVSQYDGNLHLADSLVQRLLDGLEERGLLDRSVVAITSDHGEAFAEHGRFLHSSTLYDEMIRVPLVVRLPPGLGAPAGGSASRIREPVALVDLAPTLEDLFGLGNRLGEQSDGVSVVASLDSGVEPVPRALYSQTPEQVAVVRDGWKLIVSAAPDEERQELYDLASDPGESHSLANAEEHRLVALRSSVDHFRDDRVASLGLEAMAGSLPDDVVRQLEDLGYLIDARKSPAAAEEHLPPTDP